MSALSRCVVASALAAFAPACSVDVPEAIFGCDVDSDCPPGMACNGENRCQTSRVDGGDMDAFVPDGGGGVDGTLVDAAGMDGGADARPDGAMCACDDGVACTDDTCLADFTCSNVPNHTVCTAAAGGTCDPILDCQYAICTPSTCLPTVGCQTADCDGNVCARTNLCSAAEDCCSGTCVTRGCSDSDACTTDSCTAGGCRNERIVCPQCRRCSGGLCVPDPSSEHTRCTSGGGSRCCGGNCVDVASNEGNCGGCGIACSATSTCSSRAGLGPVCSCVLDSECPGVGGTQWVCTLENACSCISPLACAPTQTCEGAPGAMICVYPS